MLVLARSFPFFIGNITPCVLPFSFPIFRKKTGKEKANGKENREIEKEKKTYYENEREVRGVRFYRTFVEKISRNKKPRRRKERDKGRKEEKKLEKENKSKKHKEKRKKERKL